VASGNTDWSLSDPAATEGHHLPPRSGKVRTRNVRALAAGAIESLKEGRGPASKGAFNVTAP